MKTAKNIALILMCISLIATIAVGFILLNRVMDLLRPSAPAPDPSPQVPSSSSESIPSSVPASTQPSTQPSVPPSSSTPIHICDYTIKGAVHEPTCDMLGYTEYACECGEVDFRDYVPSAGHLFGDYSVVAPTCTVDGWTERTCERCQQTERINFTSTPHIFDEWKATDDPTRESRTCSWCEGIQIRSTDPNENWMLMTIRLPNSGKYTHYKIEITTTKNSKVREHHIYVRSADLVPHLDFADDMLIINYTHKGNTQTHSFPETSINFTIKSDGTLTAGPPW